MQLVDFSFNFVDLVFQLPILLLGLLVFLIGLGRLLIERLVILQSLFFDPLFLGEGVLFRSEFIVFAPEIDNLILLVLYFDILMVCEAGLDCFDFLLEPGYFLHLEGLFAAVLLFELVVFLEVLEISGGTPLDDAADYDV